MSENEEIEPVSRFDKAKEIVKNNWKPFTVGVVLTGVTLIVTKRFMTYNVLIDSGQTVRISKRVANSGAFYKVFNIYTPGRQHLGPSWMIQCKETGRNFRSINMASKEMNIPRKYISEQITGGRHNAGGYHFKKIGIAV